MSTENLITELWAVHAQGPDDIYPAFDRADAERHAAELNAIPTPPDISIAAVVVPSPLDPLSHWQSVAEMEREHKLHLMRLVAPTDENLSAMRKEGLGIDGDNAYKRDLVDAVVGALAFGKQRSIQPPAGHWLERFYEIGRAEADERDALATDTANDPAEVFLGEVRAELIRARSKFPGDRLMTVALAEEFGELCKAVLDESASNVRKEAVQTAVMAARVVLDGDGSVREWRASRGLDPLVKGEQP